MKQWSPITSLVEEVRNQKRSAKELVEEALKRLEESKEFQVVISDTRKRALERAEEIDKKIKDGQEAGRLAGVPFIAKDNFLTFGGDTTAASNILKGFSAPYQATAVEKLEAEGAICIAKANLDAFGHGTSTENSDFFVTKNPHDKTRVPGGSSGGSTAAVALGIVPFSIGTDTGGSSRQPASLSGCFGYKPTYGLISRSGVVAMASSTDTIGTMAMRAEDMALVVDVMAGRDELDSTTIERNPGSYSDIYDSMMGKKIAVIKEWLTDDVHPDVRKVVTNTIEKLKKAGAEVDEISIPSTDLALAAYYIIVPAEVSSNLSRYDGQRYPFSEKNTKDLDESYELTRSHGFGNEAKRRIMIGTYVLSSGYYDAYYKKAQTVRTKLIEETNEIFKKYDFLAGPVSPSPAFKIGEKAGDPLQLYLEDMMTVSANLVGIPSVSIPAGKSDNLPIGFQLLAPQKHDRQLLAAARATEEILA